MKPIALFASCFIFFSQLVAQVGVGTTTPSSKFEVVGTGTTSATSAFKVGNASSTILSVRNDGLVEISTSTQGFLPPRMNNAAVNAISNPSQGLVVYCTDCGNNGELQVFNGMAWTNAIGGTRSPAIGSSYGGGVLAYLLQPGDQGYDPNVLHGIIAATTDQSTGISWNSNAGQYTQTTASSFIIGGGLSNTTAIIAAQGSPTTNYAAGIASDYENENYSYVWYLPSRDELNKLYLNKDLIGGFSNASYWSSTEHASSPGLWNQAYSQSFLDGYQSVTFRDTPLRVRAIRSF